MLTISADEVKVEKEKGSELEVPCMWPSLILGRRDKHHFSKALTCERAWLALRTPLSQEDAAGFE